MIKFRYCLLLILFGYLQYGLNAIRIGCLAGEYVHRLKNTAQVETDLSILNIRTKMF